MSKSKSNGPAGAVFAIVLAIVGGVFGLSYAYPALGYVLIGTSVLVAATTVWQRARGGAEGGVWLPLLIAGGVIAFASCGMKAKRTEGEGQRQRAQEIGEENRRTQAEKEKARQEVEARLRERNELIQAELARPLNERAIEATSAIESALTWDAFNREAVALAICYGDTVLYGAEPSPEIKSLKKARNRAAKQVTNQYEAELSAGRGLLCGDGTLSPSCTCRGSHQGCCSHSGGVAGCEPKPKVEIVCDGPLLYWLEHHLVSVGRALPPLLEKPAGNPKRASPLRVNR